MKNMFIYVYTCIAARSNPVVFNAYQYFLFLQTYLLSSSYHHSSCSIGLTMVSRLDRAHISKTSTNTLFSPRLSTAAYGQHYYSVPEHTFTCITIHQALFALLVQDLFHIVPAFLKSKLADRK